MSTSAIESLLRNTFAPATTGSAARAADTPASPGFDQHLHPASSPPSNRPSAAPSPSAERPAKHEDDDAPVNESDAALASATVAAPPPAPVEKSPNSDAAPDEPASEAVAEVKEHEHDKAKVKARVEAKKAIRKLEPLAADKANEAATAKPADAAATETANPTDGSAAPTATTDLPTDPEATGTPATAASNEVAIDVTAAAGTPTDTKAEAKLETITVDEVIATEETAPATSAATPRVEKPLAAEAPKPAGKPQAEKAAAPAKRKPEGEAATKPHAGEAANTASATAEPVEPTSADERSTKSGANGKKTKASAEKEAPAAEATNTDDNASTPPTGSATATNTKRDPAAPAPLPAADAGPAALDRPAPSTTAPTVAPVHDAAAPTRHAALTLTPPSADRTPGGTRLTEGEQTRFVQRVARAFEAAQQREDGEIRLRLSPPELGSLRLEVKLQGGVMSARIETETEAARTVLLDQLPALKERLAEHNIRVERFDVDLADRRSGGQAQTPDQPEQRPRFEPRRNVPVKTNVPTPTGEERVLPRPSGEKGRINVII